MQLNLPILEQLKDSQNILIAGAGGGFDVFGGLPIYFTLREMGKTVHLANYSFMEFAIAKIISEPIEEIETLLLGAQGRVKRPFEYYPEGFLAQWFLEQGDDVTVWMFAAMGVQPLIMCYQHLIKKLNIDALILVDGGVDSLMIGDEEGPGTLTEDSITLAAVAELDVPVKLHACIGFGTEVEEAVCHHHALENIAALAKMGGFLGSCSLTPQMPAFQQFEAACRYVWEQPKHKKSHITTRVIPAVYGEFGNHKMYPTSDADVPIFISPLMSIYWFFDANKVIGRNLLIDELRDTYTKQDAIAIVLRYYREKGIQRRRKSIPY